MELTLGTTLELILPPATVAATAVESAVSGGQGIQSAATADTTAPSEFLAFASVGQAIAATPAKLEKIRLLAEYFSTLDDARLSIATVYFTGQAFPQTDLRTLQVGGSVIYRALASATRMSETEFRRIASSHESRARR